MQRTWFHRSCLTGRVKVKIWHTQKHTFLSCDFNILSYMLPWINSIQKTAVSSFSFVFLCTQEMGEYSIPDKKTNRWVSYIGHISYQLAILFWKSPGIIHFFTLPLEIPEKTKLHHWIFQKIVLDPLKFPQGQKPSKTPLENSTYIFSAFSWSTLEIPIRF